MTRHFSMLLLLFVALLATGCQPITRMAARQSEVAAKGAGVMPFNLERTTHIFTKQENGGLQQVIADDGDAEQIALIRSHLAEEAVRFSQGNFHAPAMIHGEQMPGLHELVMGASQITIVYSELPTGAQILYTIADPALVTAIHLWFDAQLADHGAHATDDPQSRQTPSLFVDQGPPKHRTNALLSSSQHRGTMNAASCMYLAG